MRYQVRQRLFHRRNNSRNISHRFADFVQYRLPSAFGILIEADNHLGDIDPFGMLVEFGAAGPPREFSHALNLGQTQHNRFGYVVGFSQRCSRRQHDVELHDPFIKRRQEVAFQL